MADVYLNQENLGMFASVVGDMFNDFVLQEENRLTKIVDLNAEDAAAILREKSRKRTGQYAKNWKVKKQGGYNIVYNDKTYRLTHLLEKGANRAASIMRAFPHISPTFEQIKKQIEDQI